MRGYKKQNRRIVYGEMGEGVQETEQEDWNRETRQKTEQEDCVQGDELGGTGNRTGGLEQRDETENRTGGLRTERRDRKQNRRIANRELRQKTEQVDCVQGDE